MLFRVILFVAILTTIWAQELHSPLVEPAKISNTANDTNRPILQQKKLIVGPPASKSPNLLDQALRNGNPTPTRSINSRPKLPKPISPMDNRSKADSNVKSLGAQKLQKIITGKVTTDSSPLLVTPKLPKNIDTTSTPSPKIKLTQLSKLKPNIATDPHDTSMKPSSKLPLFARFKKPSIDSLYTTNPHAPDPQLLSSRKGTSRLFNFKKPSIDISNSKHRTPTDPATPASNLPRSFATFKLSQGGNIDNSRIRKGPSDTASALRPGKLPQTQIRPRADSSTKIRREIINVDGGSLE